MSYWHLRTRAELRRTAVLVALAGLILSTISVTGATADAQAPACTVSVTLVNSCRPWLGAAANGYPQTPIETQSQIQYHEQRIGRPLDIVHTYHPTGSNSLSTADVNFATRDQTMLFTDWNPTDTWANITNQNAAIDEMAASVKALGSKRIFLALWHEPENDVSVGGDANCPTTRYKGAAGTVADYKRMWRYTSDRFNSDGVRNVVWVMDYQNYSAFDCLVPDLWPGNDLVDWVMFNAYDNATPGSFTSPIDRFAGVLNAAQSPTDDFASKPWGIAEWGSTLTPAQDQAFYDSAKAAVDANTYPRIKAYVVYDSNGGSVPANQDLRVAYDANHTADPTKAGHYYAFAADPALSGSYDAPPLPPDTTAPSVSLSAPGDGDRVSGPVTVAGTASDDRGVSRVDLLVDGQDSGVDVTAPDNSFALSWDSTGVANGTHTVQLSASDAAGNVARSGLVTVTVANSDTRAPTAPTNLAATVSPVEVDLSWTAATDNVGVDHYNVYRDGTLLGQTTDATAAFIDTSVTPGTRYSYQVSAVDAATNEGNQSSPRVVTTSLAPDVTAPSTPSGVTAVPASSSEIDLHWNEASDNVGVTGYNVYRDGHFVATVGTVTDWADTALADASTYAYAISALDSAGNESPWSPILTASTPDGTAPNVPSGLVATPGDRQVQLNWNAATDNVGVTGYRVYRGAALVATLTGGTGPNATAYLDRGLDAGASYTYSVSAFDAAGNVSAQSAPVRTATSDTAPPTAPTQLAATVVSPGEVDLNWAAATDNIAVTGYHVYRDANLVATLGAVTSYADHAVTDSHNYSYRVDAFDGAGNVGPQTAAVTASTPDVTAPSKPTGVTAVATGSNQVQVKWSAASDNVGVAGYQVYRNGAPLGMVAGGSTSYTDAFVTDGRTYAYAVSTYDAAGNDSGASASATVALPDRTSPTVPSGLSARAVSGTQVSLSWGASTDNVAVAGYAVFRDGARIASLTATTYTDSGLTSAKAYSYTVSAYDAANNLSAQSVAVTVATADTTAPAVPARPVITVQAYNKVTVSWTAATDNVGVAGYRVYRNSALVATVLGSTSYVDATVTAASTYSYTVSAYDAAGNASASSAATSVTTPAAPDSTAPTVPAGLKSTITSTKAVYLSWTAARDNVRVTGYSVYRNGVLLGTSTKVNYTDGSALQGMKYSYTVSAYDATGNASAQTAPITVSVPDATAPTAPTGLRLTPGPKTMALSWTAATDNIGVAGYNIWRNGVKIGSVATGTTYADKKGLVTGTKYSYYVVAYDASGNLSRPSATVIGAPK